MLRDFRICLLAFVTLLPTFATAQPSDRAERRVAFRDGRAVLKGRISGYHFIDYVFPAGARESISVALSSPIACFNLLAPGATEEAFFNGSSSGARYEGAATTSGDYTARVYMMRNEARRGKVAPFTLHISVGQHSAAQENGPDFADGITGGPDYWQVTGVGAGDLLSLRATPSPSAKRIAAAANGAALKNLGCKNTRGQRWCRVSTTTGAQGWANGKFLREGAAP